MATTPRYTYDAKKDTYLDAGVSLSQAGVNRMKREYPEKMKKNSEAAKDFPPAKAASDYANKTMSHDLEELSAAEAASAVRRSGKNSGELGKPWKDSFK
jgi:hypothetical protein